MYSRGGVADAGAPVSLPYGDTLEGCEGLVVRVLGDGNPYQMVLTTGEVGPWPGGISSHPHSCTES